MAQHIDNLRGEQGSEILSFDASPLNASFDALTYGEAQVVQIKVLEDDTTLSGVTTPDITGGATYYEGATLAKGDFIDGKVLAATVTAGAIQVFLHKRTTA